MNTEDKQRFLAKVDITDACWNWTAAHDKGGYGKFRVGKNILKSHRVVYEHVHGPIPDGMDVCHHCDNPGCVNPKHLFLGADVDNRRDAAKKGRLPKGESNHKTTLTNAQVREILLNRRDTNVELAKRYGMTNSAISKIRSGQSWTHILEEVL